MQSEAQKQARDRYRQKGKHPCKDCGKFVERTANRCHSCAAKATANNAFKRRGDKHPSWKGGKWMNRGYVYVLQPKHPRAIKGGYVAEHILVWEQTHGKPLPKGWIIHHLNGIKNDNRPKNLIGLLNRKHYLVLQAKAKRIQELEAFLNNQGVLL